MIPKHFRFIAIGLLGLIGLWLAWPDTTDSRDDSPANNGQAVTPAPKQGNGSVQKPGITPRKTVAVQIPETDPRIENILADDSISISQAASMLHQLAIDISLPLSARLDALEHGLNLDVAPFTDFAEVPNLPKELAGAFMDQVMNYNDAPILQIRTYLALLNHPDPKIVETAADMLAFAVGDGVDEADPATLVTMARQKLVELRQEAAAD